MHSHDILKSDIYQNMKIYTQHGNTSCYEHCLRVAFLALLLAIWIEKRFHKKFNHRDIVRAALLHDFFLYDWHTYKKFEIKELLHLTQMHGFTHPQIALNNAKKHFDINKYQEDIILHHMWPLTIKPPKYNQSYIIILIDKYCSIIEMINNKKRP